MSVCPKMYDKLEPEIQIVNVIENYPENRKKIRIVNIKRINDRSKNIADVGYEKN